MKPIPSEYLYELEDFCAGSDCMIYINGILFWTSENLWFAYDDQYVYVLKDIPREPIAMTKIEYVGDICIYQTPIYDDVEFTDENIKGFPHRHVFQTSYGEWEIEKSDGDEKYQYFY